MGGGEENKVPTDGLNITTPTDMSSSSAIGRSVYTYLCLFGFLVATGVSVDLAARVATALESRDGQFADRLDTMRANGCKSCKTNAFLSDLVSAVADCSDHLLEAGRESCSAISRDQQWDSDLGLNRQLIANAISASWPSSLD